MALSSLVLAAGAAMMEGAARPLPRAALCRHAPAPAEPDAGHRSVLLLTFASLAVRRLAKPRERSLGLCIIIS